ncbi:MAG TPA: glycerophosphodiester phosphodiesterase [Gemmatimonadales bacterium]
MPVRGRAIVIAHRGASAYEPENSLAAFRAAVALGADGIELDVHDTADGEIVVHHDPQLGGRRIRDLSAAEARAQRLPNGEPVPTLTEALATIGSQTIVFIEVKSLDASHDGALLARMAAAPAPARCHVHGFDHRIIRRLKASGAELVAGVLSTSYPVDPFAQLTAAGAGELWQHEAMLDGPLIAGAHQRSLVVYAWTVDDAARMRAVLALGVDGICTNRPDVGRAAVG